MMDATVQGSRPLVSVILPTYNRAHTLPRAIRSVLAQTWANLELIVADDASTDDTRDVIANFPDSRLRYFRQRNNMGAAAARNLGLRQARGDFIAFQDSDDEWLLEKLAIQMEALRAHNGEYGATFGGKLIYGRASSGHFGEGLSDYRPHEPHAVRSGRITSQLLVQNLISPQALLVDARIARETGFFDERLRSNEDWDFMLRMSMKTRVLFIEHPVVVCYISGDSITRNRHSHARAFMTILKKHENLFRETPRLYARKLVATARYLHQIGRYKSAQRFLLRALKLHPWSVRGWLRLAHARLNTALPAERGQIRSGACRAPEPSRNRHPASRLDAFASSRNVPERHVQRADTP